MTKSKETTISQVRARIRQGRGTVVGTQFGGEYGPAFKNKEEYETWLTMEQERAAAERREKTKPIDAEIGSLAACARAEGGPMTARSGARRGNLKSVSTKMTKEQAERLATWHDDYVAKRCRKAIPAGTPTDDPRWDQGGVWCTTSDHWVEFDQRDIERPVYK